MTTHSTDIEVPTVRGRALVIGTDHRTGQRRNQHLVGVGAGHSSRQTSRPLLLVSLSQLGRRTPLALANHLLRRTNLGLIGAETVAGYQFQLHLLRKTHRAKLGLKNRLL
jgi:hypothetical protein